MHLLKRPGLILVASLILACTGCTGNDRQTTDLRSPKTAGVFADQELSSAVHENVENPGRVIHVVVALCDNKYQGIVPVSEKIGNGDDPRNNLYWGAGFGVKSYFRKQRDWTLLMEAPDPKTGVLERVVFRHKSKDVFFIADAYRGREIKLATMDFLRFAAGMGSEVIEVSADAKRYTLNIGGAADLIAYVGHDGLMDFSLPEYPKQAEERRRDAVILACASKQYFGRALRQTGAQPLLWTTNLMAPEAYVLKAIVDGWIRGEGGESIRRHAAEAYNRYQKCGMKGAMSLFASGW